MRPEIGRAWRLGLRLLLIWLAVRFVLPPTLPFLVGSGLALSAEPMVRFFTGQLRLPRSAGSAIAVTMACCFLALAVVLVCALAVRELGMLTHILPDMGQTAREGLLGLEQQLSRMSLLLPKSLQSAAQSRITSLLSDGTALLERLIQYLVGLAGTALGRLPASALGTGTAIISGYMISAKLPKLRAWLLQRLPAEKLRSFLDALKRLKETLIHYLTAQLQLSAVTFCILLVSFLLLRVPFAPVWAAVICLVDAFPILGVGTALLPWSLVSLLRGNGAQALGLLGVYITVSVTRSVLEPRLLGKHLGLDPLATLAAIYFGYRLWGLAGMLLAPMLAVTALQFIPEKERKSKKTE